MAREVVTTGKVTVAGVRLGPNADITFIAVAKNSLGRRAVSQTVRVIDPALMGRLRDVKPGDVLNATVVAVFDDTGTWSRLIDFE